jgi:toxin FitB
MYLLDTNVISELRKIKLKKADRNVTNWADRVDVEDLYVSVITIHELELGVLLAERHDKAKGLIFRTWLNVHVIPAFENRILPIDTTVALRGALLHVPNPRPVRDGLIAATALVHSMIVVTRNVADFHPMGVKILNPWVKK